MLRTLLLVLLSAHALPAQGKSMAIVPKGDPMIRAAAEDIPALLAKLPQSAAGKLLADPEVAASFDKGLQRWRVMARRREAVVQATIGTDLCTPGALSTRVWPQLDVRDLVRAEIDNIRSEENEHMPFTFVQLACTPKAEGRMTRLFEEHAKSLASCKQLVAVPDVKLDGHPAYAFDPSPDKKDEDHFVFGPQSVWLMHVPGVFAFGDGRPENCGKVAEAKLQPAGVQLTVDFKAYVGMFAGFGGGVPPEISAIGLDTVDRLHWRVAFAGERLLDEIEVQLSDQPGGIVGALLTGKAELPPQALPAGALLQLRCAVDLATLVESIAKLAVGETPLPESMRKDLTAAFDGSVAFGVCAPAPGGVIPRMYASLRIKDAEAFDRLLPELLHKNLPKKEVTYEGVACTVITPPGAPAALQPTFCRRDNMLHFAESGLSMRAFLKAQKAGVTAMDTGDAPLPQGAGEPLPSFDLRWDEAQMYATYHEVWLPLFELSSSAGGPALLRLGDMPEPDVVQKLTGKGRGVLRKTDKGYVLQSLAGLGGPELAALAMTWGPIMSAFFHNDWNIELLEGEIARKKLEAVWPAFEAFKKDKGAMPAQLGELFVHGKLAADALLMPGDEGEPVALPAGDERKIRSSFRYFPVPVKLEQEEGKVILIEITPRRYRRAMLGEGGDLPQVWGEDSTRPIYQFGIGK